ncbi:uncharacterized protein MAM_04551 [Metarhizium album ARSEF 1941]|uniref:DUF3533 domain-containing protein n=1 Tax=Metarhizium album (strain ARSEF 1941) TaxID=1081103 RepID=A0A0B2WN98_METAS|nr:uncharacterized protein MAM_04551 [Metarhizium album ARSEF 1941]KHN97536.1 hypothetical protein MAM_04551 [Metarhizium album ARSEF 1941]
MDEDKARPSRSGRTFPLSIVEKCYPRAWDRRLHSLHPVLRATRPKLIKAGIVNSILIQLLLFALFCHLFGALYQQTQHTRSRGVPWVVHDGGVIRPLASSRCRLRAVGIRKLPRVACPARLEIHVGGLPPRGRSPVHLGLAVAGVNTSQYNRSDVLLYIWNEARYPAVMDSSVSSSTVALSSAARMSYVALNGTGTLSTMPPNDPAALSAFANPWTVTSANMQATTHGTRVVYNTDAIVLILLQIGRRRSRLSRILKDWKRKQRGYIPTWDRLFRWSVVMRERVKVEVWVSEKCDGGSLVLIGCLALCRLR